MTNNYSLYVKKRKIKKKGTLPLGISRDQDNKCIEILFDQMSFAIGIFDAKGGIKKYNTKWRTLWSVDFGDKDFFELLIKKVIPLDSPEVYRAVIDIKEGISETYRTQPLLVIPRDMGLYNFDEQKWLIFNFISLKQYGNKHSIAVTIEDITIDKQTELIVRDREKQKIISAARVETSESERARISRDLHDSIGQLISAVKMNIETFERKTKVNSPELGNAKKYALAAGKELKEIISSLRPSQLGEQGLFGAIQTLIADAMSFSGVGFTFNHLGLTEIADNDLQLNIFRIVQEAVNNIVKHSHAEQALIQLFKRKDAISVIVYDNGRGFDMEKYEEIYTAEKCFGLKSIRERARMLGGYCQIDSGSGQGTEICIEIPTAGK